MPTHEELAAWFNEREGRFVAIAHDIWARPELSLNEHYACGRQAADLAAAGFTWEYGRVLITNEPGMASVHAGYPGRYAPRWQRYRPLLGYFEVILDGERRPDRRIVAMHVTQLQAEGWQFVERIVTPFGVAELRFRRKRTVTANN